MNPKLISFILQALDELRLGAELLHTWPALLVMHRLGGIHRLEEAIVALKLMQQQHKVSVDPADPDGPPGGHQRDGIFLDRKAVIALDNWIAYWEKMEGHRVRQNPIPGSGIRPLMFAIWKFLGIAEPEKPHPNRLWPDDEQPVTITPSYRAVLRFDGLPDDWPVALIVNEHNIPIVEFVEPAQPLGPDTSTDPEDWEMPEITLSVLDALNNQADHLKMMQRAQVQS